MYALPANKKNGQIFLGNKHVVTHESVQDLGLQHLTGAKQFFVQCAAPELASEAAALLDEHERKIRSRGAGSRTRKDLLYEARYYGQTSSARLYTGSGKKPGFTKKPTADEQLNEKPPTETPESSGEQQTNG